MRSYVEHGSRLAKANSGSHAISGLIVAGVHRGEWEVLSGADGLLALQFAVSCEVGLLSQNVTLQPFHQLGESVQLTSARMRLFKVTD